MKPMKNLSTYSYPAEIRTEYQAKTYTQCCYLYTNVLDQVTSNSSFSDFVQITFLIY